MKRRTTAFFQTKRMVSHLMKVNCSPYMLWSRVRLGYFPNGGTIRLKTSAMHTNTAGRTIWKITSWQLVTTDTPEKYCFTLQGLELLWKTILATCLLTAFAMKVALAYLSKEAFPGASSVEETFPEECNKLLSLQTPAFDLVRAFAIRPAEPVGLSGFWTQKTQYPWANANCLCPKILKSSKSNACNGNFTSTKQHFV